MTDDKDDDKPDAWVMIDTTKGKLIGGFRAPPPSSRELGEGESIETSPSPDEPVDVFEVWQDYHAMELSPCFEYVNVLGRQGEDMLSRRMAAAPYDATDGDVSVHVRCDTIERVLIIDDLDEDTNRLSYDAIVSKALVAAEGQRKLFRKLKEQK